MSEPRSASAYWGSVLDGWEPTPVHRLWRSHSDAVNVRLLKRWLPFGTGRLLKTDLFDEAVGRGVYAELAQRCREVCGVDVAPAVVDRALARYPDLDGRAADVRELPYADESFDAVFSNSTLDHFDSHLELRAAVVEIARTIRRRGTLLITLDNRTNPIVALRTSKLLGPLRRAGLVPYFVGATTGARGLARVLGQSGLEVEAMTAVMHCPPQLAAAACVRLTRGAVDEARHLRRALRFEVMEDWPTRDLSGHFVAARATKR